MFERAAIASVVLIVVASLARADGEAPRSRPVTFAEDVAPILFAHCASCHHEGGAAPFPLITHANAKKRAAQIAVVTRSRFMPPWKPEPGWGEFAGARRLDDSDIETLERWAAEGAPEGRADATPSAPRFPEGWQYGEPDLVLRMSETATIPAEGRDVFRSFVVPTGLDGDRWIRQIEFRPEHPRLIHHARLMARPAGASSSLEDTPMEGGRAEGLRLLGAWAELGASPPLPEGAARLLEKGTELVLQLHFRTSGKVEQERSSIGIHFAKSPPRVPVVILQLGTGRIDIPAGEATHVISSSFTMPIDVSGIGIGSHAHYLCKEMQITATMPDGKTRGLLWIRDWDFDWQEMYRYAEPAELPKGTRIDLRYTYDNSAANPRNPNVPPKRVRHGERSTDEMAALLLEVIPKNPSESAVLDERGRGLVRRRHPSADEKRDE